MCPLHSFVERGTTQSPITIFQQFHFQRDCRTIDKPATAVPVQRWTQTSMTNRDSNRRQQNREAVPQQTRPKTCSDTKWCNAIIANFIVKITIWQFVSIRNETVLNGYPMYYRLSSNVKSKSNIRRDPWFWQNMQMRLFSRFHSA